VTDGEEHGALGCVCFGGAVLYGVEGGWSGCWRGGGVRGLVYVEPSPRVRVLV
jgi:hypothetical protein